MIDQTHNHNGEDSEEVRLVRLETDFSNHKVFCESDRKWARKLLILCFTAITTGIAGLAAWTYHLHEETSHKLRDIVLMIFEVVGKGGPP